MDEVLDKLQQAFAEGMGEQDPVAVEQGLRAAEEVFGGPGEIIGTDELARRRAEAEAQIKAARGEA